MDKLRAVVAIAHDRAQILEFDETHLHAGSVRAHSHPTAQHGSTVRTEHEFFGHVCDLLGAHAQVLVTGSRTALADFERYALKHRPTIATRFVAYEVVDHPTRNQLVALAREFFHRLDSEAAVVNDKR